MCVVISCELLDQSDKNENVLKDTITGDETTVGVLLRYEHQNMIIAMSGTITALTKKHDKSYSNIKVMLLVFFTGRESFTWSSFHVIN